MAQAQPTPELHRIASAIDALLPQTQCAQCGYAACEPYAHAIASGEAEINRCPPGGKTLIAELAALLEREHLRQHRPVLADRAHQRVVALPGIGKNNVENLLAHPLRRKLLDQPGLGGAWPGPGAELAQAALVDVDDD